VCEVVRSTSVCLSVRSHLKNHTPKFHQIFRRCYLWLWLGPPLSSDGSTYYVLSVFWVTSWFHITEPISQNQMQVRVCFLHFAMWRHRGRSLPSPTASCKAFSVTKSVLMLVLPVIVHLTFYPTVSSPCLCTPFRFSP